jgi:nitrogen fixation NifU-like protein
MYSVEVLDQFQNPRNAGELVEPDATVQLENPACGDVLKLSVKVAGGRISEVRFLAKGCVPTIACASMLTQLMNGRTLQETEAIGRDDIISALNGVPEASTHAATLAIDVLRRVLKSLTA